jgi:thiamine biosynthesis lipoprotein
MNKIVLIGFFWFVLLSCGGKKQKKEFFEYHGFGGGTTFIIEYDKTAGNLDMEFNRILKEIESSVAISNSTSLINRINKNDSIGSIDLYFRKLFSLSAQYYKETDKAFDPTSSPLESFWGQDLKKFLNQPLIDSSIIDSIKRGVGFEHFQLTENGSGVKKDPNAIIDFKNIYRGYMVDLIAEVLEDYHVFNYKIEIGGRIKAKGTNKFDKSWSIGIEEPTSDAKKRKYIALAKLDDEAMVTSGDWRNYFSQGEKRLPFTIDPQTGYPVKHTLMSATVISKSCTEADAYSASFMVMGTEKAKVFIAAHPQLKVFLISTNYKGEWVTFMSDALKEKVEIIKEENPI